MNIAGFGNLVACYAVRPTLDTPSNHTPWSCSWGDILRQSLPGNVHLEHASSWSGRLTQAAEERALRWASLGVVGPYPRVVPWLVC